MKKEKLLEILHFSDIHPYDIQKIIDSFDNQQKEIDRLNKMIDELEKDLNYRINDLEKDGYDLPSVREQSLWLSGCYDEDKLILDKLQELKEEGK